MGHNLSLRIGTVFLGGVVPKMQLLVGRQSSSKVHLVPKELLDQVYVGHDHTPTAVAAATKLVHSITERAVRETEP